MILLIEKSGLVSQIEESLWDKYKDLRDSIKEGTEGYIAAVMQDGNTFIEFYGDADGWYPVHTLSEKTLKDHYEIQHR